MLNISKYRQAIVGCSAIATVACVGLLHSGSAMAQSTTNNSNSGGTNVTSPPSISIPGGSTTTTSSSSSAISGRATTVSSRLSVAQTNYNTTLSNLSAAEAAQPPAADTTPVRFAVDKGVADLASCGCPNADTVGSAPTTTAPSPELIAAKTAEADAAAELAAAQAEARQFIESVKSGETATSSTVASQLW
jgi:hypothetical protein